MTTVVYSITLKFVVKDRLRAAEISHTVSGLLASSRVEAHTSVQKEMAEVTARFELEIAALKEQKFASQGIADAKEKALERQQIALEILQGDHAARLKELDVAHAALLAAKEKQIQQLKDDLVNSRDRIGVCEATAARLEDDIRELRKRLADAQKPSPEDEAELRSLRTRVAVLEAEGMKNTLRAKTIESRYRTGDLVTLPRP